MNSSLIRPSLDVHVVSDASSAPEIKSLVEHLQARKKSRYACYYPDGSDPKREGADFVFEYHPRRLTVLPHMRICARNERVHVVELDLSLRYSASWLRALCDFVGKVAEGSVAGLHFMCFVSESGEPNTDDFGEYCFSCGWGGNSEKRHYVGLSEYTAPVDVAHRARYFGKAVEAMGLANRVKVAFDGQYLRVEAVEPCQLGISGADLQKRNPSSVRYSSFSSFAESWGFVERAIQDGTLVRRVDNISLHMTMPPAVYESLIGDFNALAEYWAISFYGSYADGLDPYTADASLSPDGRFPVFVWNPHNTYTFFQADVVPTPEGRRLEIHSNCGDVKRLLKEGSDAGVPFRAIESK